MIDILLATYNGEHFIKDLLNSLNNQTEHFNELLVSDDSSQDLTLQIINNYHFSFHISKRIFQSEKQLGSRGNFSKLIEASQSEYSFLCDQDDVWVINKVEAALEKMYEMETQYGKNTPILIHTDLQVVDNKLNLIANSFFKYQNLNPYPDKLISRLLIQNFITGCTILMNRSLKNLVTPIPEEAIMHDWWIALVAATLGKISYLDHPYLLYRQHQKNSVGAKKWGFHYFLSRALNFRDIVGDIEKTINQAKKFRDIYYKDLTSQQLQIIENYISLPGKSILYRKYEMVKNGYYQLGKLKSLGFFLFI